MKLVTIISLLHKFLACWSVDWPVLFLPSPPVVHFEKTIKRFQQRMHARARTRWLIILGKSFKLQHYAPKKTSICSEVIWKFTLIINYFMNFIWEWYKANINWFKLLWRLKWYPRGERWIVHFTCLEMEQSNLLPHGYILTFTLINS